MLAFAAILSFTLAPDLEGNATVKLDAAFEQIGDAEPATSIAQLDAALAEAANQPQLADDDAALAKLANARLALAWLHLANADEAAAAAAMDEALRSARGLGLDAGKFGPAVLELHDTRKAALDANGRATIEVDCKVDCVVVINEQHAGNPTKDLMLGTYRVWISAQDGDPSWAFHKVTLDEAGETRTILFEGPASVDAVEPRKRTLPRWAKIVGMTVGLGVAAGGAVLMAYNGKCQGGGDPATCPKIYDNTVQGVSMLAAGGTVFLTFGALLTVDEVRVGKAKGQQATLTWTMRF